MGRFFLDVVNMSIGASCVILVVLLLRLVPCAEEVFVSAVERGGSAFVLSVFFLVCFQSLSIQADTACLFSRQCREQSRVSARSE